MRLRDQMTCPDRIQSGFKPFCPPLHLSWVPEIGVVVGEPHQCSRIWVLLSIPWPWPWHWSSHQGFGSCHVACGMCSGMSDSLLHDPMDCSLPASSINVIFPGKNTGVSCHFLLQGIFPTQGSNPCVSPASQAKSFPTEPSRQPRVLVTASWKVPWPWISSSSVHHALQGEQLLWNIDWFLSLLCLNSSRGPRFLLQKVQPSCLAFKAFHNQILSSIHPAPWYRPINTCFSPKYAMVFSSPYMWTSL